MSFVISPDSIVNCLGALSLLKSFPLSTKMAYLSTPISGGLARFDPLNGNTTQKIVAANLARVQDKIRLLPEPVIDPTCFNMPGLTWHDYMYIWEQIITTSVSKLYFMPDWAYSDGCSYEYLLGVRKNLPCLNLDGSPIRLDVALDQLGVVMAENDGARGSPIRSAVYFDLLDIERSRR